MSTKERYGSCVWLALCELEDGLDEMAWGWHSVGEVAAKAGVSKNTARKYLDAFYEMKCVRRIGMKNRGYYHQPIRFEEE